MILYIIRHLASGREYVGSTVRTAQARWRDHLSSCFTKGARSPLYSEMREFGRAAFEMVTLEEVADYDTLMDRERAVILERNTLYPHGYNQVRGGRGNYGWQPSTEVRARMSEGQRGRKLTDEHKAKLSAHFKGRPCGNKGRKIGKCWNKGLTHSAETKAKMRAAHPKQWSKKRHQANALIDLRHSAETRKLIATKKAAWWASLSGDAKAAHILKMKQGQKDN